MTKYGGMSQLVWTPQKKDVKTLFPHDRKTPTSKMAKLILASVLCLLFLIEGAAGLGEACETDNDCPGSSISSVIFCSDKKCKSKITSPGFACTVLPNTVCDPDTLTCESGKCKLKNGVRCTTASTNCIANADCTGPAGSEKCACKTDFPVSKDNTKCGGAMGIAASMLLVVATFVTSRFL